MPDNFRQLITRDLDQIPTLPEERWLPKRDSSPASIGWKLFGQLGVAAALLLMSVVVGTAIADLRAKESDRQTEGSSGTLLPLARQDALRIGLAASQQVQLPSRQVAVAKRAPITELEQAAPELFRGAPPSPGASAWVVAIGGDGASAPSSGIGPRSFVIVLDARTRQELARRVGTESWPGWFGQVIDHDMPADAVRVWGRIREANADLLTVEVIDSTSPLAGQLIHVRADTNTEFTVAGGLVGQNVFSLSEMRLTRDAIVTILVDPRTTNGEYTAKSIENSSR